MSPTNERDAGFCSGSSENEEDLQDLHQHNHQLRLINNSSECSNSASAVSEDSSLEDKFVLPTTPVTPITTMKNKRKSSEPTRVVASSDLSQCAPIKKRIKLENEKMMAKAHEEAKLKVKQEQITMTTTTSPLLSPDPFRPWTHLMEEHRNGYPLNPAHSFKRHPGVTTLHRNPIQDVEINLPQFLMPVQDEPIALVAKKPATPEKSPISPNCLQALSRHGQLLDRSSFLKQHQQPLKSEDPRPAHQNISRTPSLIDETSSTASSFISPAMTLNLNVKAPQSQHSESSSPARLTSAEKKANKEAAAATQRNYKNMTRERRIEANARERTRVHTISAAFEKLRHSVPAYSNTQKLSKLSVLRIACSYIMSLSRIAGMDYSEDQSEPSINECVDALTKTIQTEGKLRKKKDE